MSKEKSVITNIQWNINITVSKIMAFLILLMCGVVAIIQKDTSILTLGVSVGAGLVGFRQGMNAIKTATNGKPVETEPFEKPQEE